jgi:hypothetical protein
MLKRALVAASIVVVAVAVLALPAMCSSVPETWRALDFAEPGVPTTVVALAGRGARLSVDAYPQLASDPGLAQAIAAALPNYLCGDADPGVGYQSVCYLPLGATRTDLGLGADVYLDVSAVRWVLDNGNLTEDSTDGGWLRVRLIHLGTWRVSAIYTAADGEYVAAIPVVPDWASARATDAAMSSVDAASNQLGIAWAATVMPKDRLVAQPPPTIPDPHEHSPALDRLQMLNPKYWGLTITRLGPMSPSMIDDRWSESWASSDGRFHLHYGVDIGNGMLLDDAKTGMAYDVDGPDQLPWDEGDTPTPGLPVFVGHTLVMDMCTDVLGGDRSNVVHYEINCDTLKVLRAVPLGPLSLNPPK